MDKTKRKFCSKGIYEMVISVIIPTYNRSRFIELTLESFVRQNFDAGNFEIIVADNNSTDNTTEVVSRFIENNKTHSIRYFLERRQGVHFARNSAAKIATGDFLYFTDDDMIADPALLTELLDVFTLDKKIASSTGLVLPKWESEPLPGFGILQQCLLSLNNPDYESDCFGKDCNVFSCHQMIRREVFFQTGGFNPENTKGVWIGDGETGLNIKIREKGYKFAFTRKSVIQHIIPASRTTQSYLNKRLTNQGNCDMYTYYRAVQPSAVQMGGRMFTSLLKIAYSFVKCLFNLILWKNTWRLNMAGCYYHVAGIKYLAKLISDSSWRALVLKNNWINE
ncbi:MAG: glycosyltransferase family 2 protein [Bacteroidetes bacterium]|nr:glycosyltransferase family 2 protein [Bacteroidota bacterium]